MYSAARCLAALTLTLPPIACSSDATAPPIAVVQIQPAIAQVVIGSHVEFRAEVRDASGNLLEGRTVSWSVVDDRIATVDGAGLAEGVATGRTTIHAAAGGVAAEATVDVVPAGGIVLLTTDPEILIEGGLATLTGENFSPDPAQNDVRIANTPAVVRSASTTSLEITVPVAPDCGPVRSISVQARVGSLASNTLSRRLHPNQLLELEPGDIVVINDDLCVRMEGATGTSRYLLGVQSVTEDGGLLTPARLEMATGGLPGVVAEVTAAMRGATAQVEPERRGAAALHSAKAGAPRALPVPNAHLPYAGRLVRATPRPAATPAAVPEPGDELSLIVPGCGVVDAVVRLVGERAIWLEDTANPPDGLTSADFAELSAQFDEATYPATVSYFGPPSDIDGNDRVLILFSIEMNLRRQAGLVRYADFAPDRVSCTNDAEIVFIMAPDPTGSAWDPVSREFAMLFYPPLIAHEFTHVLQLSRRFEAAIAGQTAVVLPSHWELEGQAELGSEVAQHAMTGRSPGSNYGFEHAFTEQYWYRFVGLRAYFGFASSAEKVAGAPEQCGWLTFNVSTPCVMSEDPWVMASELQLIYQAGWIFFRWLADQYGADFPGGETGLNRALLDAQPQLNGFANVEAVLGRPMGNLLARWAASLYLTGRPDAADVAALGMTSWNLYDIFQNQSASARLLPRERAFFAFGDDVVIRSGSSAYWLLAGPDRPGLSLRVRGPEDGPPAAHLQLWIARLE